MIQRNVPSREEQDRVDRFVIGVIQGLLADGSINPNLSLEQNPKILLKSVHGLVKQALEIADQLAFERI